MFDLIISAAVAITFAVLGHYFSRECEMESSYQARIDALLSVPYYTPECTSYLEDLLFEQREATHNIAWLVILGLAVYGLMLFLIFSR